MEYSADFFFLSILLFLKSGSDSSPVQNLQSCTDICLIFPGEWPGESAAAYSSDEKYPASTAHLAQKWTSADFSDRGEGVEDFGVIYREDLTASSKKRLGAAADRCPVQNSAGWLQFVWFLSLPLLRTVWYSAVLEVQSSWIIIWSGLHRQKKLTTLLTDEEGLKQIFLTVVLMGPFMSEVLRRNDCQ